jgi:hypothetical protein
MAVLTRTFNDGSELHWNPNKFTPSQCGILRADTKDRILSLLLTLDLPENSYWFQHSETGTRIESSRLVKSDPRATQVGGNHYKNLTVEPWAAMESWLTREEYIGYLRGNIIKYQARANSGKEDKELQLQKARHYSEELNSFLSRSTNQAR